MLLLTTLLQKFLNALKSLKIISNSQSIKIKDSEKKCQSIAAYYYQLCLTHLTQIQYSR